jgi:enoyl-CoA hydratase/carnithine racemase
MTTGTSLLKLEIQGHVAILTLNNPPAHTFTLESLSAIPEVLATLDQNKEVYSLIIAGDGPKFFSAGADLKTFADGDKEMAKKMADAFGRAFEAISAFRGVTIAAINGYAMGGGLECAMACDLRIAEAHAQMALPEASVGLLPCAGGTQNLTRLVGEAWAKRMILCGERVDAETALRIGLVESVCATGESLAQALELAKKVEKQSPLAVKFCKELVQVGRTRPTSEGLPLERELFVKLFDTKDQVEGVKAFFEKRKPEWKNA